MYILLKVTSYLIRVGLDLSDAGGKGLAPIDPTGEFDYIPIPEQCESSETRTYNDLEPRLGRPFSEYTGSNPNSNPHFDPEFDTYTYGEVGSRKCASLKNLETEDLLVFCAGLNPTDGLDRPRMYAIGYFTVQQVHDLEEKSPQRRKEIFEAYPANAHVKREGLTPEQLHPEDPDRDRYPVIVAGDPERSYLLDRAVPLSSSTATGTGGTWHTKYRPLGVAEHVLGLNATDLKRSNPKKIRSPPEKVRSWLDGAVDIEAEERYRTPKSYRTIPGDNSDSSSRPSLMAYVVDTDSGFAPHIKNGLLSLATCKPMIRSSAKVGDWVLGVGGSDHESNRHIVHAFRVEHTLSMKEYFTDDRFADRRPIVGNDNTRGDNIYAPREVVEEIELVDGDDLPGDSNAKIEKSYERGYFEGELCYTHVDGEYFQLAGGGHTLSNYRADVEKQGNRERVLLSADYYYFGDDGVKIPEDIATICVPGYGDHNTRRHHRTEPERVDDFSPFVDWLRNGFRPGRHGHPASSKTTIDPSETTGPGC